jgi:NH3-dependent NAD+ synthetase
LESFALFSCTLSAHHDLEQPNLYRLHFFSKPYLVVPEKYLDIARRRVLGEAEELIALGFGPATVKKVLRLVQIAEFKRRQAPPESKVTDRAFGSGWRMLIARK